MSAEICLSLGQQTELEQGSSVLKFQQTLGLIKERFEKYWVVGSIARDAFLGRALPSEIHDVDIIVPYGRIPDLASLSGKTELRVGGFMNRFVRIFPEEDRTRLAIGNVCLDVDSRLFDTIYYNIAGIEIPSFRPQTLFHLYIVRSTMRQKDFISALMLGRKIRDVGCGNSSNICGEEYRPFHIFSRIMGKGSPQNFQILLHRLVRLYNESPFSCLMPIDGKEALRHFFLSTWDFIN